LLGTFAAGNPIVKQYPTHILHPVVYQGFTLLTSTIASAVNWLVVGPKATEVMFRRVSQILFLRKTWQEH